MAQPRTMDKLSYPPLRESAPHIMQISSTLSICNIIFAIDNEQNEVTTDEKEIEEVEDSGTAEDKNPFDILEKINEGK